MSKLIITSPKELESIIDSSVERIVSTYLNKFSVPPEDKFLNVEEAANYLNLAKQTI